MKKNKSTLFFLFFVTVGVIYLIGREKNEVSTNETNHSPPQVISNKISKVANPPLLSQGIPDLIKRPEIIRQPQIRTKRELSHYRLPSSSKKSIGATPAFGTIHLKSVSQDFVADLYACHNTICSKKDSLFSTNGYYIFKGQAPQNLSKKSLNLLVTYNKDNRLYGVWENRIIIELKEAVELNDQLTQLQFSDIHLAQDKLYIVEYSGNLSELDERIKKLKKIEKIKDVRLEILYSRDRINSIKK